MKAAIFIMAFATFLMTITIYIELKTINDTKPTCENSGLGVQKAIIVDHATANITIVCEKDGE
jgi:hypothetical protein